MNRLYVYLTFAGAIPFIFCAVCFFVGIHQLPIAGDVDRILSLYSVIIASFLAGSHWGQHLSLATAQSHLLALSSNGIAVALWVLMLILPFRPLLIGFIICFILLLIIDKAMMRAKLIAKHYYNIRVAITLIVVTTLIISYIYQ